jgi:hypothetical protein
MAIIGDILGSLFTPHLIAFFFLFRIAMWEIRADKDATLRENMAHLWAWIRPRWHTMAAHPLYWAATGVATAFLLVDPLRRVFA